jgi:hypothetical protein
VIRPLNRLAARLVEDPVALAEETGLIGPTVPVLVF